ncbi:esterase OVCA2-like isoform X3 [Montipora foliosa]|uniref:esterase OVCA2-like isoform X3 n=1 Tax=Montipora foliosa TaxID=591990 RepID=UPI0035F12ACE
MVKRIEGCWLFRCCKKPLTFPPSRKISGQRCNSFSSFAHVVVIGMAGTGSLKILVLHGYRQSAQTCKDKLGAFRKGLKKLPLEFVYITAPNKIPSNSEDVAEGSNEYGWWFSSENDTYDPLISTDISKGYEESLELVKSTFTDKGPFDGVFGFSQGSCLLSILCALREQENSEELLQHFSNATILNHAGGHFIPTQAPRRKVYTEFLQQFLTNT